jgi:hypothetical protein
MAQQIRFQYQVKKPIHLFSNDTRERYEVKELMYPCDPNKNDRENLDDAFIRACELGADPNKNVRWRFIDECPKTSCLFNNNCNCFTTRDKHHPYASCRIK